MPAMKSVYVFKYINVNDHFFRVSGENNAVAIDGQSSDDDFVSKPKTKIQKVNVSTKKNLLQKGLN